MERNIILFSGALYDSTLWTNRQHVATRLAERGWNVLYVEPRLFFPRMLRSFPGTNGFSAWWHRLRNPWKVNDHLFVLAQANVLPKSREVSWISDVNHALNRGHVLRAAQKLGFREPHLLLYDTEAAQYLADFPNAPVVYDCVDDHRVQEGVDRNPQRVLEEEEAILKRAHALSVTTSSLKERFSPVHPHVVLNENVADIHAFAIPAPPEPHDMHSISHPRIGMVGALDAYKVDVSLLIDVVQKRPRWQFVLIGPLDVVGSKGSSNYGTVDVLSRFANVHLLGARPYADIPAYVHAFDVAMIPYRVSAYNASSFPLKFWEFIAAGKPVVAGGLPSLARYEHLCFLATSSETFIESVENALRDTPEKQSLRVAEAQQHDWKMRVDTLERLLLEPSS